MKAIFKFDTAIGLEEKMAEKKVMRVKLGFDPTSPNLHLGHFISLKAAKKLQDMGHHIIIIVGDFTASIGDPSGRNALRPPLSQEQINENAKTYMQQVFMVLDEHKTEVIKNGTWFNQMTMRETLELVSKQTVSQILAREDFKNRFNQEVPIFMHEMMYPIMQGTDSVKIQADLELGGTDQLFNLMVGRDLQKEFNQPAQAIMTFPLLVGLDGKKKMSKSLHNEIGLLDTSSDKFGKTMSISDETMWNWLEVIQDKTLMEIEALKKEVLEGKINPKNIKLDLSTFIVSLFHSQEVALAEKEAFEKRFAKRDLSEVEVVEIKSEKQTMLFTQLLKDLNLASSNSDATRLMKQGGVRKDGEKILNPKESIQPGEMFLLEVGKLHAKKIKML
jgi:tyrosyl-tRNA synthetase